MTGTAAGKVTEDSYFEQPALEWLQTAGWDYIHGSELKPSAAPDQRSLWSDVVLVGRLRNAVARLNPQLPSEAVRRVVELTMTTTSPEVILDHRGFHDLLLRGVPYAYFDADGTEQSGRAKLIDWANPANNEFVAVNQLTIIVGKKNRRPDILLYINGLPLGQIEGKSPNFHPPVTSTTPDGQSSAAAQAAINQVAHYTQCIPQLYRYVEVIAVSDLLETRVGTATTPAEHFADWKSMDRDENEKLTSLEITIRDALAPAAFLDLIRNFILFETDGAKAHKILAKYHQVHAVNAAVESSARAMIGDKRGGVVWHTTGVGKSYAMAFFVTKVRRDERFKNPTVVMLTDRTDLDDQLFQTFSAQAHLIPAQAESIEGDERSLYRLLDRPRGGIIFTTIQKFQPPREARAGLVASERAKMPVLNERDNILIIADEAHRSQYEGLAQNMVEALPNATRLGFTGTPVESADRNTRLAFGDYISVYRMAQAREDKAVVPIFYESRQIPVEADQEELEKVKTVLSGEEDEATSALLTAWAKLEKVVGAPDRIEKVAQDIASHYRRRSETLEGKAMVVAYSREIAARLAVRLQDIFGEEAVTCVMTAGASDPPHMSQFRRSKQETKDVEALFKKADSALRIVVVRDMWLTGFDVPSLHTLYVDKPMRDHGLIQAISRVNRLFKDKAGGLVVDYIGIGEDLRAALTAYSPEDIDDIGFDLDYAAMRLREKHEVLSSLLHGIEWRPTETETAGQKATKLKQSVAVAAERLTATEEATREYLDTYVAFARWYSNASTHPAAIEMAGDAGFFSIVAKQLRQLEAKSGEASPAAQQAVKQFFSTGLAAGEISDVFDLLGEERPQISVLSDEFLDGLADGNHPNLRLALVRKLIDDQLRARIRTNNLQAREFEDEVQRLLATYRNRQLSTAQVIQALIEIAKRIRDATQRHKEMGLTEEEAAFYDALAGTADPSELDAELKAVATSLVKSIRRDLTIDWTDRRATEDAIRSKIKRILRRSGYAPPAPTGGGSRAWGGDEPLDYAVERIITQAKTMYRYWPEVSIEDGVLFHSSQPA